MLKRLRPYLERFWVWLGGDPLTVETRVVVESGPSVPMPFPRREPEPEPPGETDPGPFLYIVQTGDAVDTIAQRFGVAVATIIETNRIRDSDSIRPGQRLLIPGSEPQREPEPPPSPESEPPLASPFTAVPIPLPLPEAPPEQSLEPIPVSAPSLEPVAKPRPEATSEPMRDPSLETSSPYVYVVRSGDTLLTITRRFNVTLRAIIEANNIEDPNQIQPGQHLLIPGMAPASVPQLADSEPISAPSPGPPLGSLPPIPWPDETIRGIYVSYFAMGNEVYRRYIIDMLTKTEINALVIDVKNDRGLISYPTAVAQAHDIGAAQPTAHDFDELMDFFKANRVYTIARIVTFRDHPFANAYPEWAVQREGGGLWHDRGELAWADPFVKAVWEYNADLAEEAARRGFDEIQFDYVHFPVPSQEGPPRFAQSTDRMSRVAAVTTFLSYIRERLASLDVRLAVDVVGYACWRDDDTLIGQDLGRLAQYLDVLCPMLYPSSLETGIPGYDKAIDYPYEVVFESMKQAVQKAKPLNCLVRPWIQDFPDYHFDRRVYGPAEVHAQMQGSFDAGGNGYMAWNPKMEYSSAAYFQKTIDMSSPDDYN